MSFRDNYILQANLTSIFGFPYARQSIPKSVKRYAVLQQAVQRDLEWLAKFYTPATPRFGRNIKCYIRRFCTLLHSDGEKRRRKSNALISEYERRSQLHCQFQLTQGCLLSQQLQDTHGMNPVVSHIRDS